MSEPGPEAFVEDLWPAIRQAAAIARALEGRVANRPKEGEGSDVKAALTIADTAAQEALLVPLLRRFAGVHLEAEEDTESVHRFRSSRDARVVIDPIDGTLRSYLHGEGPYAVMAGLVLEGGYRAAVLALPREELFFRATAGDGALVARGAGRARAAHPERDGDRVMVSYELPEPVAARLREHGYRLVEGCGGAVSVAPLLPGFVGGVRVPRPAPLSIRGRIGLLVSLEAGARVASTTGDRPEVLAEPAPDLAVAANDAILGQLLDALSAA